MPQRSGAIAGRQYPPHWLVVDRDGFCVGELACAGVVVMKDDLRVWEGDPTRSTWLLQHVEGIVNLGNAVVRVEVLEPRQVGQDVAAPADVTLARTKLPPPGRRQAIRAAVDPNLVVVADIRLKLC